MRPLLIMLAFGLAGLAAPGSADAQDPAAVAEGARQWSRTCARCHNARPSAERTDRQWRTIIAHMRARANLTRSRARAIAVFLQATNGRPAPVGNGSADPARDGSAADDAAPAGSASSAAGDTATRGASAVTANAEWVRALSVAERQTLLRYLRMLRNPR